VTSPDVEIPRSAYGVAFPLGKVGQPGMPQEGAFYRVTGCL
jgi:hypothetical protein